VRTALIGHTGFVGSNLLDANGFDDLYNSADIGDIAGREYDLVVSSGNRADSHRINGDGPADLAEIDALADTLERVRIRKLVLISTVCVYPWGGAPDEDTPLSADGLTPYGANRLHQERRLGAAFDTLPVRLPQLYGARLRKGVVYDLANDYRVEHIDPAMHFQHYDVRRLWGDIRTALDAGIPSLNVATPPISNATLAAEVFGRDISGQVPPGSPRRARGAEEAARGAGAPPFSRMYTRNMTTRHAALFGGTGPYLEDVADELAGLRAYAAASAA